MHIIASGAMREATGIGVMQRHLYPELQKLGIVVTLTASREPGAGPLARIIAVMRAFKGTRGAFDAYLCVVPPLPLWLPWPTVTVVHDLRWERTRKGISRLYRRWDLRRAVKRSQVIVCVSDRTRDDLVRFDSRAAGKTLVAWEGPGVMPPESFSPNSSGIVLLIGGATHKRNELAAEVLALSPAWCRAIIGVGVSTEVRSRLDQAFPTQTEWHDFVSDEELVEFYRRAEVFVFLGVEEGFGLPYIEALSAGCQVVAIDQPLTRSLLGDAAVLINDGSAEEIFDQIEHVAFPDATTRNRVAERYSWATFAEGVVDALRGGGRAP